MGQRYLSTDPNFGEPLRPQGPPPPPDAPSSAFGEFATGVSEPFVGAYQAVTHPMQALNGLASNLTHPISPDEYAEQPHEGIARNLGRLLTLLAAPEMAARVPAVGRGAVKAAAGVGDYVNPDVIGAFSPRAGNVVRAAQRMRGATPEPPPVPTQEPVRPPRPGSFEEYIDAPPERQAQIVKARKDYLLRQDKPATTPVQPTTATRTAKAAAQSRETSSAAPAPASPAETAAAPGLKLTPEEQTAFDHMVQQGHDPQAILRGIQEYRQSAPAPPPSTTATQAPMPTGSFPRGIQSAAELKEFDRLLAAGKSRGEALQLIQQLRGLQQAHGLPTSEQATSAVLDRNTRGRWPE